MADNKDEVPDFLPEDFDEKSKFNENESEKKDSNKDNDDDEEVVVSKAKLLKFQAAYDKLFESQDHLIKQNEKLVIIAFSLVAELKSAIDSKNAMTDSALASNTSCIDILKKNEMLIHAAYELRAALDFKIKYQYLKYFLCAVLGFALSFIVFTLSQLF